jgi:hypothetical protein
MHSFLAAILLWFNRLNSLDGNKAGATKPTVCLSQVALAAKQRNPVLAPGGTQQPTLVEPAYERLLFPNRLKCFAR